MKKIEFKPIHGVRDGFTCLSIYPPGTFIDNKDYAVFVGGCGVGHQKTLETAKRYLLYMAEEYCLRHIADADMVSSHYRRMLKQLESKGLQRNR